MVKISFAGLCRASVCDEEYATFLFFFFLSFLSLLFSQVMAKWWDEAVLLRIGLKLEQFRYQTKKPSIYYDTLACKAEGR